ncbi:polymorphic toxin-type HINT domain-containing protein [Saccharomonospora saliphila]|uniref:polymorphic toxin-type HINT domain-containing protein n=1 Tax=Saccharomonospora saliphila TaxID=369829 RepID=UPI00036C7061|nr:polymorphic toxin-type HINT domain-containing protein [Saccharomonospora saliphila]
MAARYFDEHTRRLHRTIVDAELPQPMQADTNYSYDPAGNITSIADTPREQQADVQCFEYDHLRRLTEAWTPMGDCGAGPEVGDLGGPAPYWRSFGYDVVGNRVTSTEHDAAGDTVREYAYPDGGQALESVTSHLPGGTTRLDAFTYDEAGNTVSRTTGAGDEQTLDWDAEGNLAKTVEGDEGTEFVYDADGERLLRRDPSGVTAYLEGQELRWDRESGQTTTTRYYEFAGSTVAMRTEAGLTWLLGDHQGTSRFAIGAGSLEVTRRWQLPFGGQRGEEVDFPGERGFVGGTVDASAGFTTLGARQYDPGLGRFLSVDPLMDPTDPQRMHGYTYSNNNPVTFSDPTGLAYCDINICPGDPGYKGQGAHPVYSPKEGCVYKCDERPSGPVSSPSPAPSTGGGCGPDGIYCGMGSRVGGATVSYPPLSPPPPPARDTSRSCTSVRYCGFVPGRDSAAFSIDLGELAYDLSGLADAEACLKGKLDGCLWLAVGLTPVGRAGALLRSGRHVDEAADAGRASRAPSCNSFVPGTRVLMADGTTKPIEDVEIGEKVWATDPETGEEGPRTVTATIVDHGMKNLVEVTVDVDGAAGDETSAVMATTLHPFWVDDQGRWLDARDVEPGNELRTATSDHVEVVATDTSTKLRQVHNLTINGIHTYHVLANGNSILVHNSNGSCGGAWQSEFDNLPKGRQEHVREMPDEQTMRDAFERWTAGAEQLPARGPKIPEVYQLEDGTVIQWKTASASGGKTIDIQPGSGGKPLKIHLS